VDGRDIIPGPSAPKHFDVCWWMIFKDKNCNHKFNEVFIKYGPASAGVQQKPHYMHDLHYGEHIYSAMTCTTDIE
jgi:hypothetical protein